MTENGNKRGWPQRLLTHSLMFHLQWRWWTHLSAPKDYEEDDKAEASVVIKIDTNHFSRKNTSIEAEIFW